VFDNYGVGVIIYESILTVFVISNFGLATFMDPGVYPQGRLFSCQFIHHRLFCYFAIFQLLEIKW